MTGPRAVNELGGPVIPGIGSPAYAQNRANSVLIHNFITLSVSSHVTSSNIIT